MFVKIVVTLWVIGAACIANDVMKTAKAEAEKEEAKHV